MITMDTMELGKICVSLTGADSAAMQEQTRQVLANGLALLGVCAPESM